MQQNNRQNDNGDTGAFDFDRENDALDQILMANLNRLDTNLNAMPAQAEDYLAQYDDETVPRKRIVPLSRGKMSTLINIRNHSVPSCRLVQLLSLLLIF